MNEMIQAVEQLIADLETVLRGAKELRDARKGMEAVSIANDALERIGMMGGVQGDWAKKAVDEMVAVLRPLAAVPDDPDRDPWDRDRWPRDDDTVVLRDRMRPRGIDWDNALGEGRN